MIGDTKTEPADNVSTATPTTTIETDDRFVLPTFRQIAKTDYLLKIVLVLLMLVLAINLAATLWQALSFFANLLLLFFVGWTVALLLTRPVRYLVEHKWPKMLAIVATFGLLLATIGLLIALVLPGLIAQTQQLISNFDAISGDLQKVASQTLGNFGIKFDINQLGNQLQGLGGDILRTTLNVLVGLPGIVINILLVVIISISLLASQNYGQTAAQDEASAAKKSLTRYLPTPVRNFLVELGRSFEHNFGVFLGGQILVGFAYGLGTGIVMGLTGFDYAVTTAVIVGVLMIIPFFGGPLSLLPPLFAGIGSTGNWLPLWALLILLYIVQTILLNVVLPKLIGGTSGVGPLLTLFVLLAGAQIGGIWGVLLGVPLAGVAKNLLEFALAKLTRSELVIPGQNGQIPKI